MPGFGLGALVALVFRAAARCGCRRGLGLSFVCRRPVLPCLGVVGLCLGLVCLVGFWAVLFALGVGRALAGSLGGGWFPGFGLVSSGWAASCLAWALRLRCPPGVAAGWLWFGCFVVVVGLSSVVVVCRVVRCAVAAVLAALCCPSFLLSFASFFPCSPPPPRPRLPPFLFALPRLIIC